MRSRLTGFAVLTAALLLLAAAPVLAAKKKETPAPAPTIDEKSMTILKKMGDFLGKAGKYTVTVRSTHDSVQVSGQKIEFGRLLKYTVSRPDRLRVDSQDSDGKKGTVVFDGKAITAYGERRNAYASAELKGSLDDAVVYFVRDLKMQLPLAMLFVSNVTQEFEGRIRSLAYVETDTLLDVPCDHLAGSTDTVDFQIWVAQGNEPLPRRVLITYRQTKGEPQFRAWFSEWNLSPNLTDAAFAFTPSEGVERIPFLVAIEAKRPKAPSAKKGGKP
jgi:hypothetical protein